MKKIFINPGAAQQLYQGVAYNVGIEPPYWIALKAAIARAQGISVKVIDAEAENLSPQTVAQQVADYNPDGIEIVVMGITPACSSTPKMDAAITISHCIKNVSPKVKQVFSGLHPSALPFETFEQTYISKIVSCITHGEPDDWPIPAWDLLPMDKYRTHAWHCMGGLPRKPYASLYTSFGCPFDCSYCSIHALYGNRSIKFHSPKRVIQEIDLLVNEYGVSNIKIIDDLFTANEEHVLEICRLVKSRNYNLNIWAFSRIDTITSKMASGMVEAGIRWHGYGIEVASDKIRRSIGKNFSLTKIYDVLNMSRSAGANIIGDFMFGLPDDNLDTMRDTLNFAKDYLFEFVNFYVAIAYPGSHLYNEAIKNNIKLPSSWQGYSQYAREILPLPTKYLTAKEVLRFRDNAYIEYFTNPIYLAMIKEKFGQTTVDGIKELLTHKLERDIL